MQSHFLFVYKYYRFKHLPNGKALSGDKLREELDKLAQSYIERADRLLNLGSTQSNESFNNSVASFAPKNRYALHYFRISFDYGQNLCNCLKNEIEVFVCTNFPYLQCCNLKFQSKTIPVLNRTFCKTHENCK